MHVQQAQRADVWRMNERENAIKLEGELDALSARGLNAMLSQIVGDIGATPTVDLTHVTFLDSTVLGSLVHAAEQLRRQGRSLSLTVSPGPVAQLFETSGLTDRFDIKAQEV